MTSRRLLKPVWGSRLIVLPRTCGGGPEVLVVVLAVLVEVVA